MILNWSITFKQKWIHILRVQLGELFQGGCPWNHHTDEGKEHYLSHAPFLSLSHSDNYYLHRLVFPVFKGVCKLNYIVCTLLCLTSFTHQYVDDAHPHCVVEVQFYCCEVFLVRLLHNLFFSCTVNRHLGCYLLDTTDNCLNFPVYVRISLGCRPRSGIAGDIGYMSSSRRYS